MPGFSKILFIDDERHPSDSLLSSGTVTVARNFREAMRFIIEHKPQEIHFDHDLGYNEPTGYDVAKELIMEDMDDPTAGFITENFTYHIHSQNPIGARNIDRLLYNYIQNKFFT